MAHIPSEADIDLSTSAMTSGIYTPWTDVPVSTPEKITVKVDLPLAAFVSLILIWHLSKQLIDWLWKRDGG